MRHVVAICLTMGLSIPTGFAAEPEEVCPSIGEMAASIMQARQGGTIMSTAMGLVPADNILRDLAVDLVKKAYAVPQYSVEENRNRAVIEFRNDTELACYTSGD